MKLKRIGSKSLAADLTSMRLRARLCRARLEVHIPAVATE